jgi:excisionase family DNA binding protein
MSAINEKSERLAYSINEFCRMVGVSRTYFYELPEAQKPRTIKRGRRVFIPADAAREWLSPSAIAA